MISLDSCTRKQRGRSTNYDLSSIGACGYGNWRPTYTFAASEAFFNVSNVCGACFEVTGPTGSQIFMAADECPVAGNEAYCSGDLIHFDIASGAFPALAPAAAGVTYTQIRPVVCPSNSTYPYVGVLIGSASTSISQWYIQAYMFNHRVPISAVSVTQSNQGGVYTSLNRTTYNSWEWSPSGGLVYPLTYKITSIYGETVSVTISSEPNPGDMIFGTSQFSQWPSISGSDTCPSIYEFDIYYDGLNTGGKAPTAENYGTTSSANWDYTDNLPWNATAALQKGMSGWEQWPIYTFGSMYSINVPASQIAAVQFQIWSSANATGVQIVWSDYANNQYVTLDTVTPTWTAYYFPISAFAAGSTLPDLDSISIKNGNSNGIASLAIANLRLVPASGVVAGTSSLFPSLPCYPMIPFFQPGPPILASMLMLFPALIFFTRISN